ncbi:MAG TPA: glycosyltransferase [Anaerolineaceae bacterium]|nr:glycosyltransferase [Anaerolineaceae bacterium]
MRIAVISTSPVPSTTAHSIQMMKAAYALSQVDSPVRLWTPGSEAAPWPKLSQQYGIIQPFEITWVPSRPQLRRVDFVTTSVGQVRQWGADVLYTWTVQAAVAALLQHIPVILELHDRPTGFFGKSWLRMFASLSGEKRVLMITHALRSALEMEFNLVFPDSVVQIAPNGCDLEQYAAMPDAPTARQRLALPERLTAVYSGHLYSGRGMDILLALASAYPEVQFIWAGGKPESVKEWQHRIEKESLDNIYLTGFLDHQQLPLMQSTADILLMPYATRIAGSGGGNSADICSPMKMFDYLATGRAIMTSDLPVIHEILTPACAVFCPPEDESAWVQAFGDLVADAAWRSRLGACAQAQAAKHTWRARASRALADFPSGESADEID